MPDGQLKVPNRTIVCGARELPEALDKLAAANEQPVAIISFVGRSIYDDDFSDPLKKHTAALRGIPRLLMPCLDVHVACADRYAGTPDGGLVPNESHMRVLIDFLRDLPPGPRVFQCRHGISRSAAAAYVSLALDLGQGHEGAAARALFKIREQAEPNDLMIRMADAVLGSGSKLESSMAGVIHTRRIHRLRAGEQPHTPLHTFPNAGLAAPGLGARS